MKCLEKIFCYFRLKNHNKELKLLRITHHDVNPYYIEDRLFKCDECGKTEYHGRKIYMDSVEYWRLRKNDTNYLLEVLDNGRVRHTNLTTGDVEMVDEIS